jgi:hypothetical protein
LKWVWKRGEERVSGTNKAEEGQYGLGVPIIGFFKRIFSKEKRKRYNKSECKEIQRRKYDWRSSEASWRRSRGLSKSSVENAKEKLFLIGLLTIPGTFRSGSSSLEVQILPPKCKRRPDQRRRSPGEVGRERMCCS